MPTLRRMCRAAVLFATILFPSTQAVAAQEISERFMEIDGDAMSGEPRLIRASIDEYKKLPTLDSDPQAQWRLLRAYGNLFSELTCRDSAEEQKAAAKTGYEFTVKVDAANSDQSELVYYYADISGRYYQDHLLKAIMRGFDPIGNCQHALEMDEKIEGAGPHRCLGSLHLSLPWPKKDTKEALKHLQAAIALSPKRVANRFWLARALAVEGRYDDAWTYVKGIQETDFDIGAGKDVSSKHWATIYTRRVENLKRDDMKEFAKMKGGDQCGDPIAVGEPSN